jgi:hypothetical protein
METPRIDTSFLNMARVSDPKFTSVPISMRFAASFGPGFFPP